MSSQSSQSPRQATHFSHTFRETPGRRSARTTSLTRSGRTLDRIQCSFGSTLCKMCLFHSLTPSWGTCFTGLTAARLLFSACAIGAKTLVRARSRKVRARDAQVTAQGRFPPLASQRVYGNRQRLNHFFQILLLSKCLQVYAHAVSD